METNSEHVVHVRGLRKTYGGRVVVDDLDLDVRRGEVLGLIGANGAGKTTSVEILQGLRRADAGEVTVLGLDPVRDADRLRPLVGSQLQSSGLPDRMRVHEAVRLFSGPRAADADGLIERFGLGHRRRSPFGSMSGGERQRLFLVLALLNRPQLVILDELTQGLDPAARREVWTAVDQLRDAGHDGAAGHPRAGRGRGAVRPGGRDARRPGAGRGHAGRAGRPARAAAPRSASGCHLAGRASSWPRSPRSPGSARCCAAATSSPSTATAPRSPTSAPGSSPAGGSPRTCASTYPTWRAPCSPCSTPAARPAPTDRRPALSHPDARPGA